MRWLPRLADSGQSAPAAEVLQKALQLAPADPETWYRYGILDSTAGRISDALDKIRKAISLDPTLPEKSRRLGEILANAGRPDDAQVALRDALRIDPYDDDAWDLAARIFAEKGQVAEAMFHFERAIRLRPTSAAHLYDYALALARVSRFDQAQQRAEEALRADPNSAEAHELLGGLFERKPQLPDAAREYQRALALRPEVSRACIYDWERCSRCRAMLKMPRNISVKRPVAAIRPLPKRPPARSSGWVPVE